VCSGLGTVVQIRNVGMEKSGRRVMLHRQLRPSSSTMTLTHAQGSDDDVEVVDAGFC
jgi:hypothetical protein